MANILPNFFLCTDGDDEIVYETSYVESPATAKTFLAFSENSDGIEINNNTKLHFATETSGNPMGYEYVTSGVWMMPNTKYLRVGYDDQMYTVEFTAEALKRMLLKYLKAGNGNQTTEEHGWDYMRGFYAVEHWIIESKDTKSPIYGLTLEDMGYDSNEIPIGTVMKSTYISDKNFWYDKILTGKVQGYSIGGIFGFEPKKEDFKKPELGWKDIFNQMGIAQDEGKILLIDGKSLDFSKINGVTIENKKADGEYQTKNNFNITVKNGTIVNFYAMDNKDKKEMDKKEQFADVTATETVAKTNPEVAAEAKKDLKAQESAAVDVMNPDEVTEKTAADMAKKVSELESKIVTLLDENQQYKAKLEELVAQIKQTSVAQFSKPTEKPKFESSNKQKFTVNVGGKKIEISK